MARWRERRSAAPKPRGGSISPLEEFATEVLALIAEQPDVTLVETVAKLRKRRIRTSRSSLWRFLDRHNITLKKSLQAAERPDLTLVETVAELRRRRIRTSRSSLWRFLDRHNITFKKKPASCRTAAGRCGASAPTLDARARHA